MKKFMVEHRYYLDGEYANAVGDCISAENAKEAADLYVQWMLDNSDSPESWESVESQLESALFRVVDDENIVEYFNYDDFRFGMESLKHYILSDYRDGEYKIHVFSGKMNDNHFKRYAEDKRLLDYSWDEQIINEDGKVLWTRDTGWLI